MKIIKLPVKLKNSVLALGSQAKNSICFARGQLAYLSPARPDLGNPKDFLQFEKSAVYFLKQKPGIIAYDLHPEYASSKFALSLRLPKRDLWPIQHHHAHIASCMAENGIKNEPVIGVAFDGTGLGIDNTLWGGEFFISDYRKFIRAGHLKPIPMLGGEAAIRQPLRLALVWLNFDHKAARKIPAVKLKVFKRMYAQKINSPLTSSMGRLFDAAASLILGRDKADFEAELASALEKEAAAAHIGRQHEYPFRVIKSNGTYIIDPRPVFKAVLRSLEKGEPVRVIALRFHMTAAAMVRDVCLKLRSDFKINKVALSGGVFQNKLLLGLASGLLYEHSFKVMAHTQLSCNDSGIALGQAVIAGV